MADANIFNEFHWWANLCSARHSNSINPNLRFLPSELFSSPPLLSSPSFLTPVSFLSFICHQHFQTRTSIFLTYVSYNILSILLPNRFWYSLLNSIFSQMLYFKLPIMLYLVSYRAFQCIWYLHFSSLKPKYSTILKHYSLKMIFKNPETRYFFLCLIFLN